MPLSFCLALDNLEHLHQVRRLERYHGHGAGFRSQPPVSSSQAQMLHQGQPSATRILMYEYMESISQSNIKMKAWTQATATDDVSLSKKPSSSEEETIIRWASNNISSKACNILLPFQGLRRTRFPKQSLAKN